MDPDILGGKPTIRGTRISVEFILELYASGGTRDEILKLYPHLRSEDVEQALLYAINVMHHVTDYTLPIAS